jgi:hypothetical protein
MASVLPTARKEPLVSAPHPKDPCPSSDGTFLETLRMAFPDTQGKPAVSLFENLQLNAVRPGVPCPCLENPQRFFTSNFPTL